jgi:hypothetical protein
MLPIVSIITMINYTTFLFAYRRRRGTTQPLSWFSSIYALVFSSLMAAAYVPGIFFVAVLVNEDTVEGAKGWHNLTSIQKVPIVLQIIGATAQVGILTALFGYGLRVRKEMKKGASFTEGGAGDVGV